MFFPKQEEIKAHLEKNNGSYIFGTVLNMEKSMFRDLTKDEIYNDSHLANTISEDLTKLLSSNLLPKEQLEKLDKLIAKCIGIEELGDQKLDNLKEKLL